MSEVKIKSCPKCGKKFECLHTAECWCMDYQISPDKLELLKRTYPDCLCPECLAEYSTNHKPKRCG
jgi:ribosomal protein L34E